MQHLAIDSEWIKLQHVSGFGATGKRYS